MAEKIGIGEKIVIREIDKMVRRVSRNLPRLKKASHKRWPSFCYGEIAVGIDSRIAQIAGR